MALPQLGHLGDVGRAHVAQRRRRRVGALGLEALAQLVAQQAELLGARVGVDQAECLLVRVRVRVRVKVRVRVRVGLGLGLGLGLG